MECYKHGSILCWPYRYLSPPFLRSRRLQLKLLGLHCKTSLLRDDDSKGRSYLRRYESFLVKKEKPTAPSEKNASKKYHLKKEKSKTADLDESQIWFLSGYCFSWRKSVPTYQRLALHHSIGSFFVQLMWEKMLLIWLFRWLFTLKIETW